MKSSTTWITSAQVKNTDALDASGTSVFLQPGRTTDIYFIAQNAGLFTPRCADHDWAGMTATIAYAERWVRSVKEECLSKVIPFGQKIRTVEKTVSCPFPA